MYFGEALTINNSTIRDSRAPSDNALNSGGGLHILAPNKIVTINNSTFSGNSAPDGSAVYLVVGTLNLNHVTMSDNNVHPSGETIGEAGNPTTLNIRNSIMWGNTGGNCDRVDQSIGNLIEGAIVRQLSPAIPTSAC